MEFDGIAPGSLEAGIMDKVYKFVEANFQERPDFPRPEWFNRSSGYIVWIEDPDSFGRGDLHVKVNFRDYLDHSARTYSFYVPTDFIAN